MSVPWDNMQWSWLRICCNTGDLGSNPGLGRPPGEGNGNPLQYSFLENSMDREVWQAVVHRVAKSQTWLEQLTFNFFHWNKNRNIDQWNSIKSLEITLCPCGQLIYDKGSKTIQWRKDSFFKNVTVKTGQLHVKK